MISGLTSEVTGVEFLNRLVDVAVERDDRRNQTQLVDLDQLEDIEQDILGSTIVA
jgi:hypothetical protein